MHVRNGYHKCEGSSPMHASSRLLAGHQLIQRASQVADLSIPPLSEMYLRDNSTHARCSVASISVNWSECAGQDDGIGWSLVLATNARKIRVIITRA
jgi:hypothetical protein